MHRKLKRIFTFLVMMSVVNQLFSQTNIETKMVYNDTVNYPFTSEWQYLSTDIYLFNADKFDQLINEMEFQDKGRKWFTRTNTEEKLEYLFVSASLKKVKFLNNSDLVYPLYNFQINRDKDNKYRTYVSDNISHIRIIDNLPLYSAGNNIDAEIKVQAITNNNSDMLINLVGKQLQGLAEITTPSAAVFSLIGEFGSFLESNTRKKEYRFTSTIRLYEQQNFDTRLHSVKVFVLHTPKSKSFNYSDSVFSTFIDTTDNPRVDRNLLNQLVNFNELPVLVVCNYRSMYQMDQISGDEVTQEAIDERRAKLLIDYKNGLISDETYKLERDFLRFLTLFVELKNSLELYKLNQSSGNVEVTHKSLPKVLSRYSRLLALHDELEKKYKSSPIFSSVFIGEYDEIISFARLYLDADPSLRTVRQLAEKLKTLELEVPADSAEIEQTLLILHKGMEWGNEFASESAEGIKTGQYIIDLERKLNDNYFKSAILDLDECEYSLMAEEKARLLKRRANLTQCKTCSDETMLAIERFNNRILSIQTRLLQLKKDSLTAVWSDSVLTYITLEKCLKDNLFTLKQNNQEPTSFDLLSYHHQRFSVHLNTLLDKLKVQFQNPDLETLQKFNESLSRQAELTKQQVDFFRRNNPRLLICNSIKPLEIKTQPGVENQISTDSLKAEIGKQLQIFRELDLVIYSRIDKVKTDSAEVDHYEVVEENRSLIEELGIKLNKLPKTLTRDEFKKLKGEIDRLVKRIGENFNKYCINHPDDCVGNLH